MRKFFKIPDHLRSVEWQNEHYLRSTAQARMFDGTQASKQQKEQEAYIDLLSSEPVDNKAEATSRRGSLRKKLAMGALAAATVLAPTGQYAMADAPRQAEQAMATPTEADEIECYQSHLTIPAEKTTRTFTIYHAPNDALTVSGKRQVEAEFGQSEALNAARDYLDSLDAKTELQVQVHGVASDDNRQNMNAGIGEKDTINEQTAQSYAAIATNALKKLFTGDKSAPLVSQSIEERILAADEQRQLEEIQTTSNLSSTEELITAYNQIDAALSVENYAAMDELIGKNRGVEITVLAATPEMVQERTVCVSNAASATPLTGQFSQYGDPKATLPGWSRVKPVKNQQSDPYGQLPLGLRLKLHANAMKTGLMHDVATFKEDMQFIGRGIATAAAETKDDVLHQKDAGPRNATRFLRHKSEYVRDSLPSVKMVTQSVRARQERLNKLAQIPTTDIETMSRNEFYTTHRVFPEDYAAARRRNKTLPLRRKLFSKTK